MGFLMHFRPFSVKKNIRFFTDFAAFSDFFSDFILPICLTHSCTLTAIAVMSNLHKMHTINFLSCTGKN